MCPNCNDELTVFLDIAVDQQDHVVLAEHVCESCDYKTTVLHSAEKGE